MHQICGRVVLGLFLAGCLVADSPADTPIVGSGGSSGVLDSSTGPFDPVIEEPLRPLFADPTGSSVANSSACGSMAMAMAPFAVLMLQSFCSARRKRPARLA